MGIARELRGLLKDSSVYFLADILPKGINFFLLPLYTLYLTRADYGILSLAQTFGYFFQIALVLGMDSALMRFYYEYRDEPERLKRLVATLITFLICLAAPILGLSLATGDLFVRFIVRSKDFAFDPHVLYALLQAVFYAIPQVYVQLYRAARTPWKYFAFKVSSFVVTAGLVVWFVVVEREGAVGSLKGQCIAAGVFCLAYALKFVLENRLVIDRSMLFRALHFGLPIVPSALTGWLLFSIDRVLIERYLDLESLGIYAMAGNFCLMVDMSINAFNSAYAPFCYEVLKGGGEDARRLLRRLASAFVGAGAVLVLGFMCVVEILVRAMTAESYHGVYPVAEAMAVYYLFRVGWCVLSPPIMYFERTTWLYWLTVVTGLANVGIDAALIPRVGLYGAVVGTVLSGGVLRLVIAHRMSWSLFPIDFEWRVIGRVFLLFCCGAAGVLALERVGGWTALLGKQAVFVASVGALFGLGILQVEHLRNLWRGVRGDGRGGRDG